MSSEILDIRAFHFQVLQGPLLKVKNFKGLQNAYRIHVSTINDFKVTLETQFVIDRRIGLTVSYSPHVARIVIIVSSWGCRL